MFFFIRVCDERKKNIKTMRWSFLDKAKLQRSSEIMSGRIGAIAWGDSLWVLIFAQKIFLKRECGS